MWKSYYNKRRQKRIRNYVRGIPRAIFRAPVNYATGGLIGTLAAEAKRFVTAFVGTGLNSSLNYHRIPLTTIPKNVTTVTENSDARLGRKIFIKGVSYSYLARTTANNTQPTSFRFLIVWQKDPSVDLLSGITSAQYWSPIGSTRSVRIIMDKYYPMTGTNASNGSPTKILKGFKKIKKMTQYDGSTLDGTDISLGAIIVYFAIDPTRNSVTEIFLDGNSTISYKETV